MPRKTVSPPQVADTFLWRVCKALDEPPRMLAANLGVPYAEVAPLLLPRPGLVETYNDEVWWKLSEYVDRRLGEIMAARNELQKAVEKDRQARVVRHASRHARQAQIKKGSPRGKL